MSSQQEMEKARELIRFQLTHSRSKITATYALLIVIAVLFGLEELYGGSTNVFVLVKMGANVGHLVSEGEYYRILTSVFLHAGFLHVFINSYVLFALGGFLNRILGDFRFLTIFFISGITGSLASVFIGKSSVSVGASGAIWGLFGACIALSFFKNSLIPEILRLRLRRVMIINLVINLGVSFLPMVDLWAHLGGGIGGLITCLFIIAPIKSSSLLAYGRFIFRFLTALLSLLYMTSIVYAQMINQPWQKTISLKAQKLSLTTVPFKIAVPKGFKETARVDKPKAVVSHTFGKLGVNQYVVEYKFFSINDEKIVEKKLTADWIMNQKKNFLKDPSIEPKVKKTLRVSQVNDEKILSFHMNPQTELKAYNYVILRQNYLIRLVIITSDDIYQKSVDNIAFNLIEKIESY